MSGTTRDHEARELVAPTTDLHAAWLEAHVEWGPGLHEDGFGLLPTDEVRTAAGFARWVTRLVGESARGDADGTRYRWILEGDAVVGGIALRYGPDAVTGHIGYGIRPSARRRGLATWALGRILVDARELGMGHVSVVCAADNVASAKTIERSGGVLEGIRQTGRGLTRCYRIELTPPLA
ncbi:GNAT family N-acetyltransferase [Nocardia pseudobrasiliensis]|uniref:Putative acetyltransferase n=1 Tax=Nocardia pseudobrasiliensis TaxID=45979 RepID=A0A370IEX4_9NOCA|nr:GNAT family N-acetyltransferase [Nocardia pseudobrasiliensis]RDI69266.1 putative acetyltransferase [Nocardia pseudobrasiliensis]